MSRTASVSFRERNLWAYDVSLSILLAELINVISDLDLAKRPRWLSELLPDLRRHAILGANAHLDLDLGLSEPEREHLTSPHRPSKPTLARARDDHRSRGRGMGGPRWAYRDMEISTGGDHLRHLRSWRRHHRAGSRDAANPTRRNLVAVRPARRPAHDKDG